MTDTFEASFEALISERKAILATVIAEQLAAYPWDNTAIWDALTVEEKLEEYSRKTVAEAAVRTAEAQLVAYKAKKSAFYDVTKTGDMETFDAEYRAARQIKLNEWQDKENYATATGDWELVDYKVNWSEI